MSWATCVYTVFVFATVIIVLRTAWGRPAFLARISTHFHATRVWYLLNHAGYSPRESGHSRTARNSSLHGGRAAYRQHLVEGFTSTVFKATEPGIMKDQELFPQTTGTKSAPNLRHLLNHK
jgi:hypothetical protein